VIIIKQRRDEKKEREGEPFFLAMEDSQSHIYISSGNLIIRQVKYLLPTKHNKKENNTKKTTRHKNTKNKKQKHHTQKKQMFFFVPAMSL
jgi:hypothetical protein